MTSQLLNFSKSLTSLKNVAYRALLIKQTECSQKFVVLDSKEKIPDIQNLNITC